MVTHQDFYRAERRGQLSQGDIVVAPTVMAWSPESRPAPDIFPQIVADLGSSVLSPAWSPDPPRNIPSVTTETRWGPAIVLSHDCSIDKEFNEKVDRLIHAEGLAERDAVRAASEDRTLDPYIVVSPLYDYARLPANKRESVRSGQRYGFFPLPSLPGFQKPEYDSFVDLRQLHTVERCLLGAGVRVASLRAHAVHVLRYKIAEEYASRHLSLASELEQAIGKSIVAVRPLSHSRKKGVTIALDLDDGTALQLAAKADPVDAPGESSA